MTVEMSIVGSLFLFASTYKSPDGEAIRHHGFFYGWTLLTMVIIYHLSYEGVSKLETILSAKSPITLFHALFFWKGGHELLAVNVFYFFGHFVSDSSLTQCSWWNSCWSSHKQGRWCSKGKFYVFRFDP